MILVKMILNKDMIVPAMKDQIGLKKLVKIKKGRLFLYDPLFKCSDRRYMYLSRKVTQDTETWRTYETVIKIAVEDMERYFKVIKNSDDLESE